MTTNTRDSHTFLGIYYGWVIVFGGLLLTLIMYGVAESFGVMLKSVTFDLDADRGAVSLAFTINWIAFGVSALACGMLSDRYGSRPVMFAGAILFVCGTLLMSQVRALWQLYLCFGILMAAGRAACHVPLAVLVTKSFVRNQGLALAISQSQNVGLALFAPLGAFLLASYGWRGTYLWLGLAATLMIPLSLLMRPVRQAATPAAKSAATLAGEAPQAEFTLRQALRTRVFWTITLAAMCCCIAHSDILLHGVSYMTDCGLTAPVAASVVGLMAVCGMVGKISSGLIADRIGAKPTLVAFLTLQAFMILFLLQAERPESFYLWAVLFGVGFAGPMPIYSMLFRQHFGTRAIGSLLGSFFILSSFGMGMGGLMGGVLHEVFGSYTVPFTISAAGGFVAAILILTLPGPGSRSRTVREEHPRVAPRADFARTAASSS
jgi:MFS family permease